MKSMLHCKCKQQ